MGRHFCFARFLQFSDLSPAISGHFRSLAANLNVLYDLVVDTLSQSVTKWKLFKTAMALNPNYEQIGKAFTDQYYRLFDDPAQRPQLVSLYNPEQSLMTFEGQQMQGAVKIMEKVASLTFQKIQRSITACDTQPTFDGGVLISVLGQLKTDDDPPHGFTQTFVLKPDASGGFYIQHDMFRLVLHSS